MNSEFTAKQMDDAINKAWHAALEQAAGLAQAESDAYAGKAMLASHACADVAKAILALRAKLEFHGAD